MGAHCSSCQNADSKLQINSQIHKTNAKDVPALHEESRQQQDDSWQDMEKLVAPESNFGDNTTVHSVISERKSMLQVQLQSREAESKIIEDEIDCGDEEESQIIYKAESQVVELPNFLNAVTKKKIEDLGVFLYSKAEFQIPGSLFKSATLIDGKYIYQGQWKDDKKNGRGKQIWSIGSVYQGYWRDNKAYGMGRLIHDNGDVYQGQWLNDQAEGYGVYTEASGMVFMGNWKNDKRLGYGEETWPDGAFFKGMYVDGMKHGQGRFQWPDSSWYEGQFQNNNISGKGTYHWKDGNTYEGEWVNNKMHGKGIYKWADGRVYQGEYKQDRKHGYGELKWPDGRNFKGNWVQGKQVAGQGSSRKGVLRSVKALKDKSNKKLTVKQAPQKVKFAANPS